MKDHLLVVTDCTDIAANELHAVLERNLEANNAASVCVDPIAYAAEFSIANADFLTRLLSENYDPEHLTILAVVNPLDTSSAHRARIALRLRNGIKIVGANTGAFSWLIEEFGVETCFETSRVGISGDTFVSFGGKYIHAPIAAEVARTNGFEGVSLRRMDPCELVIRPRPLGEIVHIDNFGVAKLNLHEDDLGIPLGKSLSLYCNGRFIGIAHHCRSMKELPDGDLALYRGSSLGLLEIGIVREMGTATSLELHIGDIITWHPTEKASQ